jgi:hypothetical protein
MASPLRRRSWSTASGIAGSRAEPAARCGHRRYLSARECCFAGTVAPPGAGRLAPAPQLVDRARDRRRPGWACSTLCGAAAPFQLEDAALPSPRHHQVLTGPRRRRSWSTAHWIAGVGPACSTPRGAGCVRSSSRMLRCRHRGTARGWPARGGAAARRHRA